MPIRRAILAQMQEIAPLVFGNVSPLPLAIGIHRAIAAALPAVAVEEVNDFMGWWCRSTCYQHAVLQGERRYLLNGEPAKGDAGSITTEHREGAKKGIKALARAAKERKKEKAAAN